MDIELSRIKPSPRPIRKSWDEGKMEELAQSIREQGVIVPIKVRPANGDTYEVVYGHRRVEAARRAGLGTIPAIVEGVEDDQALIQALIENVQREDMNALDKAEAIQALMKVKGWNGEDVARAGIMDASIVSRLLSLLQEPDEIQSLVSGPDPENRISELHAAVVRRAGLPPQERVSVLQKAAKEGLSRENTRRVAESIKVADTPARKDYLLKAPYSEMTHDPEFVKARERQYGAHDPMLTPNLKPKAQDWEDAPEVRDILFVIKQWQQRLPGFRNAGNTGKLSPEARQFIAHKLGALIADLQAWRDSLESKNG